MRRRQSNKKNISGKLQRRSPNNPRKFQEGGASTRRAAINNVRNGGRKNGIGNGNSANIRTPQPVNGMGNLPKPPKPDTCPPDAPILCPEGTTMQNQCVTEEHGCGPFLDWNNLGNYHQHEHKHHETEFANYSGGMPRHTHTHPGNHTEPGPCPGCQGHIPGVQPTCDNDDWVWGPTSLDPCLCECQHPDAYGNGTQGVVVGGGRKGGVTKPAARGRKMAMGGQNRTNQSRVRPGGGNGGRSTCSLNGTPCEYDQYCCSGNCNRGKCMGASVTPGLSEYKRGGRPPINKSKTRRNQMARGGRTNNSCGGPGRPPCGSAARGRKMAKGGRTRPVPQSSQRRRLQEGGRGAHTHNVRGGNGGNGGRLPCIGMGISNPEECGRVGSCRWCSNEQTCVGINEWSPSCGGAPHDQTGRAHMQAGGTVDSKCHNAGINGVQSCNEVGGCFWCQPSGTCMSEHHQNQCSSTEHGNLRGVGTQNNMYRKGGQFAINNKKSSVRRNVPNRNSRTISKRGRRR
tara:strand:+ start:1229 stop:2767 length:1539 start_codon:yes stop_codon:yes gene_type:complete